MIVSFQTSTRNAHSLGTKWMETRVLRRAAFNDQRKEEFTGGDEFQKEEIYSPEKANFRNYLEERCKLEIRLA